MIVECPGCKSRHDVSGRPAGTRARCRCGTVFNLPDPAEAAGKLSCPGCGAVVAGGDHHCQFCRAELLVRACPRCFARIFHGHSHCPHCGVVVGVPAHANADGSTSARRCPSCSAPSALVARVVGGVLIDECPSCLGLWLDAAAVERLVRERQKESLDSLRQMMPPEPALSHAAEAAAPAGRRMYISCPDCDQVMNRVNFARRSGIIVDVCRGHGTWFDASELPRVVDFVLKGGVEESQRREVDELREKARRAAADAEGERMRAAWSADGRGQPRGDLLEAALGLIGSLLR